MKNLRNSVLGLLATFTLIIVGCPNPSEGAAGGIPPFMSFNTDDAYIIVNDDAAPYDNFHLELASPATTDITVALSFSEPSLFNSPPTEVIIRAGNSESGVISMISLLSTGESTITATHEGKTATATIHVYDPGEDLEIKSFTPATQTAIAGLSALFTVELIAPAGQGGQTLTVETTGHLSAPVVIIPGGEASKTFSVEVDEIDISGERITVSNSHSSASAQVDIHLPANPGLVIAEVFYDPVGNDSGMEWVKIYNGTSSPIDLSDYTLKWGGAGDGELSLSTAIQPWSSQLIGGSDPAFLAMDFTHNFEPDLGNAVSGADFVALYETGEAVPISAVLYGGSNDNEYIDESGSAPAEAHVGDALSGQSIALTAGGWVIRAVPTPELNPPY